MDPLTQGVLGTTASQLVSRPEQKWGAAVLGFFAGMAADLDVLIRSDTDPLLALEYHRQFTHALVFVPVGALICAVVFYFLFARKRMTFAQTYLFSLAGYATHALLDACTTYGTQLFWPFSNARVAWNNISVIDPLFTLPLLTLVAIGLWKRSTRWAAVGAIYGLTYLALGVVQNQRAESIAEQLIASRGHTATNLGLKPSFANIITWKSVYEYQGRYYVDAIRVLGRSRVIEGSSTEKLDLAKHFPWLDLSSQQAKDVERFRWFSNQHLGIDPDNPQRIIDIRYSLIPNRMDGMWGIELDQQAAASDHARWTTTRPGRDEIGEWIDEFWGMIKR
ncbi:MAG: metal-dependent hydrolase [Pseudomonadota bacterium]